MGLIAKIATAVTQRTISSSDFNRVMNQIFAAINGGIENVNIKPGAGIRQDEGKLALDYDEIRAQVQTLDASINGSVLIAGTVYIDAMEYGTNEVVGVGLYNNGTPGSLPVNIPAGSFDSFMQVIWSGVWEYDYISGLDVPQEIALLADSTTLTTGQQSVLSVQINGEPGEASRIPFSTSCYINMTNANNYTSNPPTLNKATDHTLDIDLISGGLGTITRKNLMIFGR